MLNLLQKIFAMEGLAYLYPLIWLFFAGFLLSMMPKEQMLVCGKVQRRWVRSSAFLLVLPLIFWAGLRGYVGDMLWDNYGQKTKYL